MSTLDMELGDSMTAWATWWQLLLAATSEDWWLKLLPCIECTEFVEESGVNTPKLLPVVKLSCFPGVVAVDITADWWLYESICC